MLLKKRANRYLDGVMKRGGSKEEHWERQWKEESKRRRRKSLLSKWFPAELNINT